MVLDTSLEILSFLEGDTSLETLMIKLIPEGNSGHVTLPFYERRGEKHELSFMEIGTCQDLVTILGRGAIIYQLVFFVIRILNFFHL